MHVAFFTVRMRKGFGVDLCVDKWARGLLDPAFKAQYADLNPEPVESLITKQMFHVKHPESAGSATDSRGSRPFADKVTVFCFDYDGETYKDAPYDIVPLHLTRDKANRFLPIFENDALNTLRNLKSDLGVSGTFDLAVPASFPFYAVKKVFGTPAIHLHFGNPPTFGLKPLARINRRYLDYSDLRNMGCNDVVVAISEYLKNELPKGLHNKTEIVYPGADHMPAAADSAVSEMRARVIGDSKGGSSDVFVLCVSRLDFRSHPYKGVIQTAEIVGSLQKEGLNARLVLAGVGPQSSIEELRSLGAIVVEAPTIEELAALYSACDIFVSLSRWEGFGLPVAEAAIAGLPTIALNSTAHAENAVSCPINSDEEAKSILAKLVTNASLRLEKGLAAQKTASRFTWNSSCRRLIEIAEKNVS